MFFYHDFDGNKCIANRTGVSSVSFEEAKFVALVFAINALKAVYSFEVQNYNYRDLIVLKDSYEQIFTYLRAKYTEF